MHNAAVKDMIGAIQRTSASTIWNSAVWQLRRATLSALAVYWRSLMMSRCGLISVERSASSAAPSVVVGFVGFQDIFLCRLRAADRPAVQHASLPV